MIKKETLQYYIEKQFTFKQVAKDLNCSVGRIQYWLKKYDLKLNFDRSVLRPDYSTGKTCTKCNKFLSKDSFHARDKVGNLSSKCKDCHSSNTILNSRRGKQAAVNYKGGECMRCGYSKCISALDFHHRDPSEKDFSLGNFKAYNLTKETYNELDKCDLLCANCHREVHHNITNEKYGLDPV